MRNSKYYYIDARQNIRWTVFLDRDEDWWRSEHGNYYTSRWEAENARAFNKTLRRIFVRKVETYGKKR